MGCFHLKSLSAGRIQYDGLADGLCAAIWMRRGVLRADGKRNMLGMNCFIKGSKLTSFFQLEYSIQFVFETNLC